MTIGQYLAIIAIAVSVGGVIISKRRYDLAQIEIKDKRKRAERKYRRQIAATFAKHKREIEAAKDLAIAYQKKYELLHNHVKMLDQRVYDNKKP